MSPNRHEGLGESIPSTRVRAGFVSRSLNSGRGSLVLDKGRGGGTVACSPTPFRYAARCVLVGVDARLTGRYPSGIRRSKEKGQANLEARNLDAASNRFGEGGEAVPCRPAGNEVT